MSRYLRNGTVSSIDYDTGMVSVTYPSLDGATTAKMPCVSFNDEYKMPDIGDDVIVLHNPEGEAAALLLGHTWNRKLRSPHNGKHVYRKELGPIQDFGAAYVDYDHDGSRILTIEAPRIRFVATEGEIELRTSSNVNVSAGSITNTGQYVGAADVLAGGISLIGHTHAGGPPPG